MAEHSPPEGKAFGHYRIQGQIGAGGMGVVYSAYDTLLERKVAIKVVGDRLLADQSARDLLLHEARAASALNHPNICTIHQVGDSDGEAYIVMEHVEGQLLSSLVGSAGLSPDLVVRYGVQIADALAHAHKHGVIHRDLKSTNVLVTPEGRVKVLDFGLATRVPPAELQEAVSARVPLTESSMIAGTLPYLAPELLRAHPADARTDIWALGVLLSEMASGKHPFPGRTAFELSSAILRDPPTPLPASVPLGLRAVILRCLAKSPGERYQQAAEVYRVLEALRDSQPALPPKPDVNTFRFTPWLLLPALLLVVIGGVVFDWRGSRDWLFRGSKTGAPLSQPRPQVRKSVAVLSFQNASNHDETAWLSGALSSMLATELSAGEKLRMIPAENVARMERDLSLRDTNTLGSDTLKRVHNYLGSDLMLVGAYTALGKASGGQIRVDVRLQDSTTGETIAAVAESGSEVNLFDLVSRVGSDLRRRLDIGEVAPVDAAEVRASYPATPEAARLYTQGLSELRLFDSQAAFALLGASVAADPKFPLAHYALALAWSYMGYDDRAKDEAKLAFELSGKLSRQDRLLVEGRYRELTQDWTVATEVYRTLVGFFPDNVEYGLRLANAQSRSGKTKDALDTVVALRMLPPPQNQDPRIDLQRAYAMRLSGNAQGMLAASVAAANQAAAQGSRFVEASARLSEGTAEFRLGEKEKALTAWEKSRLIWASAGYPGEVAKIMLNTGIVLYQMGDLEESKKRFEDALSIWKTSGNKAGQMNALGNLANLLSDEGDLTGAKRMHVDSLAIARELKGQEDAAQTLAELGDDEIALGDVAAALTRDHEALESARQSGDRGTLAEVLAHSSRAFYFHGDLPSARQSTEEALETARQVHDKSHEALAMTNFGEILMAEGDLPQARKSLEEALKIRTKIEEISNAAGTRLQLAALSIEEGNLADAEQAAREVRDEYRKEKHPDDEISADVVLLRALDAEKKFREAQKEDSEAKLLVAKSQNVPNRLGIKIVEARMGASAGRQREALQSLSISARDAAKCGFLLEQLEALFAHAEIEINSGQAVVGRAELSALKKDASAKGFGLIVQKATTLMSEKHHGA
jgi:eukaryotic-like serine/threonine-protein kinase